MSIPPARSAGERKRDALNMLRTEVDAWVASASDGGDAYLIPLSYYWDGTALTISTPAASRTAMNLRRAGRARVALGRTRDVVIIEGPIEALPVGADPALEDAHAEAAGFDPRESSIDYVYIRITPDTVMAWREENELKGRQLMRDGVWLA